MNPSFVDLKPNVDVVEDQGADGACTGYAGAKAMDTLYARAIQYNPAHPGTVAALVSLNGAAPLFSPMDLWQKEKVYSGTPGNVGVSSGDIPVILQAQGICLESTIPDSTPIDTPSTPASIAEAANYKITGYDWFSPDPVNPTLTLKKIQTYMAKGYPVLAAIVVYNSMENVTGPWQQQTWDFLASTPNNAIMGEHELPLLGYDDVSQHLLAQNSWGPNWGDGGFLGTPYTDLTLNYAGIFQYFCVLFPTVPVINAGWRPDMTAAQIAVQQAYIAYFGRPADLPGLNYWSGVVSAYSNGSMIDAFAASTESQALYGTSSTPTQIITEVYQNLFGHAPDAPGLAYWVGVVSSGAVTIGNAIYSILTGAQGTDATTVSAKIEAANVLTYSAMAYDTASIPATRSWLAAITTESQVQSAVQALPC